MMCTEIAKKRKAARDAIEFYSISESYVKIKAIFVSLLLLHFIVLSFLKHQGTKCNVFFLIPTNTYLTALCLYDDTQQKFKWEARKL